MKKFFAMVGLAASFAMAASPAFALGDRVRDNFPNRTRVAAPEIDVGSGTKALVVLAAGLLLAGERLRRR